MDTPSVCAVVVTYHPSPAMVEAIAKTAGLTQRMVVVDNGSSAEEIAWLRRAGAERGFALLENGENLGIGEALNRGMAWARAEGFAWVLLLDQDSRPAEGFLEEMFRAWAADEDRGRVGSVQPRYLDPETGLEADVWRAADGGPVVSMTSGSLMPVWIFEKAGPFASDFFIDAVDHEYCLRIRAAGYRIIDARKAVLYHSAGAPEERRVLGIAFRPSGHNAVRRYYLSRNRVLLYRRYFFKFPGWILKAMWRDLRETAKCFVGERDRGAKLRSFVAGTWDGLMGKAGRRGS